MNNNNAAHKDFFGRPVNRSVSVKQCRRMAADCVLYLFAKLETFKS
jgi:hypothetical protein